jgi:hypothetical protein
MTDIGKDLDLPIGPHFRQPFGRLRRHQTILASMDHQRRRLYGRHVAIMRSSTEGGPDHGTSRLGESPIDAGNVSAPLGDLDVEVDHFGSQPLRAGRAKCQHPPCHGFR